MQLDALALRTVDLATDGLIVVGRIYLHGIDAFFGDGDDSTPSEFIGKIALCVFIDATPDGLEADGVRAQMGQKRFDHSRNLGGLA